MQSKHNKQLVLLAKQLRKEMTKEERHLWYDFLRTHPVRFSRQKILGKYIADFYSAEAKLVIELDGSQHYEPAEQIYDRKRTEYLNSLDICVLRFSNLDVLKNLPGVCQQIDMVISSRIG